jgi:hypothetical protein
MSTQETVNRIRAEQSLYTAVLAFLTILFLRHTSWLWSSLYFQHHTATEVSLSLGVMAVIIFVCVALLRCRLGQFTTIKLIDVGITLLIMYVGFNYLKQLELIPQQSTPLGKALAIASAILVGLLTLKFGFDTRKRFHLACIVGGLIFIFFPLMLASTNANKIYWPTPSHQLPTVPPPNLPAQNTIVLLLDELSDSAAGPIVESLEASRLHVTATNIDPAGKDTINVIPAIWTRTSFDQAVTCGPTQICNGTKVLDFSKVKASSQNIDIVGFYHRYCSIQDLRSCSFATFPKKSAMSELFCSSLPGINTLVFLGCDTSESDRKSFIDLLDSMQKTLLEAPFWQNGGILFAHLLVPHPLMGIPLKTLSEEYADNVENGAKLVKLVAQKAKLVFGDNFRIIVFSDHPLRAEMWCANKTYMALKCQLDASQISTQVPLIIATPNDEIKVSNSIKNNKAVFDLLYNP